MTITREDLARTARAGYMLTDDDKQKLRDEIAAAITAALLATYRQAASALRVPGAASLAPTRDFAQGVALAAAAAAASIVETFAENIAAHIENYLEAAADAISDWRDAISGLVSSVRLCIKEHSAWKSLQVAQAETGAGIDEGSEEFAADYLDGNLDVPDDIDPQNIEVAVVPEEASNDLCAEYAGNTYPIEDYQLIPDFPIHPFCPHSKIVQYITDEAAQSAA